MEPVTVTAIQLAIMAIITTTPGPLFGRTLILFKNNVVPTKDTLLADLIECDFVGYAAVAAQVFGTAYIDPLGLVRADCPSVDFIMTASTTPNTVYGWALVDSGKTIVVEAAQLANPIPLTIAHQGLTVQPTYAYGD